MSKGIIYEFFPHEYLLLQKEMCTEYHPKLHPIIAAIPPNDIDMKLAHIAAYCEVALDGAYELEDRVKLCVILTEKLMLKREMPEAQVILPI